MPSNPNSLLSAINEVVINRGGTNPPNPGTPIVIQAENYNSMAGVQTEATTDAGGGSNVGWIDATDWMAFYNINFPVTGTYKVEYRVASLNGGGRVSCDLNAGSIQLGAVDIPSTGGWQNWTTVSHNVQHHRRYLQLRCVRSSRRLEFELGSHYSTSNRRQNFHN